MSKQKNNTRIDFENILLLIEEVRNRAFGKVNAELVMLYYHVGGIVALKVEEGVWGEGTIDQLAEYIQIKQPGLRGILFNNSRVAGSTASCCNMKNQFSEVVKWCKENSARVCEDRQPVQSLAVCGAACNIS